MKACCQKPSHRLIVVYLRESWNSGAHTSPMAQPRTLTDSPNFLSFTVQHLAPRIPSQVVFPNFPLLHVVELRGNPGMSLHWQHSSAAAVIWQKINRQIIITILIRIIVIIMMMMMIMLIILMGALLYTLVGFFVIMCQLPSTGRSGLVGCFSKTKQALLSSSTSSQDDKQAS